MISEGSYDTEDWSMMLEIQLCIIGINYSLEIYSKRKYIFEIVMII